MDKKAMALNPYHPERFWGHLDRAHSVARQYDEAIVCFRKLTADDAAVHACLPMALQIKRDYGRMPDMQHENCIADDGGRKEHARILR